MEHENHIRMTGTVTRTTTERVHDQELEELRDCCSKEVEVSFECEGTLTSVFAAVAEAVRSATA